MGNMKRKQTLAATPSTTEYMKNRMDDYNDLREKDINLFDE